MGEVSECVFEIMVEMALVWPHSHCTSTSAGKLQ